MAGKKNEEQELRMVRYITKAVRDNKQNPVTVVAGKVKIDGVIKAEKYTGRQLMGSEPYTDLVLHVKTMKGIQKLNLSLKDKTSPSLAGGGLSGLKLVTPGLVKRFLKVVHAKLSTKIKPGSKVPDVYGKINRQDKIKIVVGTAAMGGPIHYMYIGPMQITSRYDAKKNELILDGNLTESVEYATTHELYFRMRARRIDQRFDPTAMDKEGNPKIYGVSQSHGDSAGRIAITDYTPSGATTVTL